MSLGPNDLHPLEIEDARAACFKASEKQRDVEQQLRGAYDNLADAERGYRKKLTERILALKAEGVAATVCADIARGETEVANLRHNRDVAEGVVKAIEQQAYRRAADRKDVHQLLRWSQQRDMRTEG